MKTNFHTTLFILMVAGFICLVASFALRADLLSYISGVAILVCMVANIVLNIFDGQILKF